MSSKISLQCVVTLGNTWQDEVENSSGCIICGVENESAELSYQTARNSWQVHRQIRHKRRRNTFLENITAVAVYSVLRLDAEL